MTFGADAGEPLEVRLPGLGSPVLGFELAHEPGGVTRPAVKPLVLFGRGEGTEHRDRLETLGEGREIAAQGFGLQRIARVTLKVEHQFLVRSHERMKPVEVRLFLSGRRTACRGKNEGQEED